MFPVPLFCNLLRRLLAGAVAGSLMLLPSASMAQNASANQPWENNVTADGSAPVKRHETAAAVWNNRIYLIGGRGTKPVDQYDAGSNTWVSLLPTPTEMHHFQPLVWNDRIYLLGGFACCYPNEPALTHIQIYDPATDTWSIGAEIPAARRRGGAAAVVFMDRFYMIGGNTLGHNGGAVAWFDVYDPATDTWSILPDAPDARDHFNAVIVEGLLVAASGRQTEQPNPFLNTVSPVNIYDFSTSIWTTGSDIPTPRAGAMTVGYGTEAIVIGGEVSDTVSALDVVEAYDIESDSWRTLQSLNTPRHSGGVVVFDGAAHIIAGGKTRGGGGESTVHEKLTLDPDTPPPVDTDVDGLSDVDEIDIYGTAVNDADTDDDQLSDGKEVSLGTNPLHPDTDLDTLSDGEEVLLYLSNPLSQDTDQDSLLDQDEINVHQTNPRVKDTDNDGLDDNIELAVGTDPRLADTDGDGLDDGTELNQTNTSPNQADTDLDLLSDGDEVNTYMSDPLLVDTDGDTLTDGVEVQIYNTSPILADTDADQVPDNEELALGYDPLKADTDGDGISDFDEINSGQTTNGQTTDGQTSQNSGGGVPGAVWLAVSVVAWFSRRRWGVNSQGP